MPRKGKVSDWRAARFEESRLRLEIQQRHWLWLHGACVGSATLGVMWALSALQMALGQDSLALRYLISLGVGYVGYLGIVRLWAGAIARRETLEPPDPSGSELPSPGGSGHADAAPNPTIESGGGGEFGGGGATGDFSAAPEISESVSEVASGALEAAGAADEGAVVVIPVLAIFLAGLALLLASGSMLMLVFGWDVLLAVAVELAFSYASARTLFLVTREGWFSAAMRLTWKPLLGTVLSAVIVGGTIDYFLPQAHSLPQAIELLRAAKR